MARARNIKPAFFKNADLVETSFETRLLFAGLWTLADREGRLLDRPKQIKMELFPADNVDVDACLNSLFEFGFIDRYIADGKRVIQIINFSKHQIPHGKEADSQLPDEHGVYTVHERNKSGLVTGNFSTYTSQAQCKHSASTVPEQCEHPLNPESPILNPEIKNLLSESGDSNSLPAETKTDNVVKIDSAKPQIPYQQIIDAYHEALPELPAVRLQTESRRKAIKARWMQMLNSDRGDGTLRYTDTESGIRWWTQYFNHVRHNSHWLGDNDRGWTADFDWLLNLNNFTKVLEYRPRASA
jgi:hypothetical protein